jgi:REP element-mobilizing transposase RayT
MEVGRKTLPHLGALHKGARIVFVTQAVDGRRALLAREEAVRAILEAWRMNDHWLVGRYVIMPDHLHFFCSPRVVETSLRNWMQVWRACATRGWNWAEEKPIWQKDFFDRELRSGESYAEKWRYVVENPVRAGLVERAEEWKWQGELNVLRWVGE